MLSCEYLILHIPVSANTSDTCCLWLSVYEQTGVFVHMALQHVLVFRWSTCSADKWVHTANVTLLWQSDTTPGLLLSPQGVSVCLWRPSSVPVLWQGHNLPRAECVFCASAAECKSHDSTTAEARSVKLLIPSKSPQQGLKRTSLATLCVKV